MKDIDLNIEQLLRYFFSGVVALAAWHIAYEQLPWLSQQDAAASLTLGVALALVIGTLIYAVHRALIFPWIHRILLLFFWQPTSPSWRFWITEREQNFYDRYWKLPDIHAHANRPMREWAATIHFLYCSGWGILAAIFLGWCRNLCATNPYNYLLWGIFVILVASASCHNCRFVVALRDMK